eukprot:253073-Pleurochrysis_carterae.AAC.2
MVSHTIPNARKERLPLIVPSPYSLTVPAFPPLCCLFVSYFPIYPAADCAPFPFSGHHLPRYCLAHTILLC